MGSLFQALNVDRNNKICMIDRIYLVNSANLVNPVKPTLVKSESSKSNKRLAPDLSGC